MTDQYIVFSLAGTAYAVPTSQVAHVEMLEEVTRVPNAPAFVDGIVFSRGAVVPAMNLRARFGFERTPYDTRTRLLIVQTAGRTVGLVVDSAREFQAIPASAIVPPGAGLSGLSGPYLRGIATIGDRMIMVLDLDGLLDAAELQATTAITSQSSQELQ
jgi:purine-binding chemotaxis protein CheW